MYGRLDISLSELSEWIVLVLVEERSFSLVWGKESSDCGRERVVVVSDGALTFKFFFFNFKESVWFKD